MQRHLSRRMVALATAALLVAGCSGGGDDAAAPDAPAPDGQDADGQDGQGEDGAPQDPLAGDQELPDPAEDIRDGVYRGQGVTLPVPDGWTVDPASLAQGVVVARPDGQDQQLTAQSIPAELLAAAGDDVDLDTLLDRVREQIPAEAVVDEDVELAGAEQAHRLTYEELPGQQQGAPATSTTILLAQDARGLFGEFTLTATTDAYDEQLAETLLAEAGFDPDSEPPAPPPVPAPAPEEGGG